MAENAGSQHPEQWRQDLNPNANAGENTGPEAERAEARLTLADIKEAYERFPEFQRDELRAVPVLREGERLEQGGTYVDLMTHDRDEFKALGNMEATYANWFVRKQDVGYEMWNRLTGRERPESVPGRDE